MGEWLVYVLDSGSSSPGSLSSLLATETGFRLFTGYYNKPWFLYAIQGFFFGKI